MNEIVLNKDILKFAKSKDFVETVLHEMIHAYLYQTGEAYTQDNDHGEVKLFIKIYRYFKLKLIK